MTAVCVDNHTVLCYTNASVCTYVYCRGVLHSDTHMHTYVRTYVHTYICLCTIADGVGSCIFTFVIIVL